MRKTIEERFWDKVRYNPKTGCDEFIGSRTKGLYGHFRNGDKLQLAHRFSWELVNGKIPEGIDVLHHCDNPPCVTESHLFLGDDEDNARDRDSKGRGFRATGEKNGGSRLTWKQVNDIREIYEYCGVTKKELADIFLVHPGTIGRIINNSKWKI